ncbi:hypothetical protein NYR55_02020 [Sphingomonas sp. BGYR3]|uniref:hypothetical protein n=1 Tax=Sphingomonas sp. BGYR3 TaxID=2975483 RepID=UPI0021A3E1E4|nr:hypothetical protein [Sphingomonas sp. BGYR3]MDG5487402.1 hypothetical protein [Sphingomonas sp. BGYR3]
MIALLVSLVIAAGMLTALFGILFALEQRGALWLDLIRNGARPFDAAAVQMRVTPVQVRPAAARQRAAA